VPLIPPLKYIQGHHLVIASLAAIFGIYWTGLQGGFFFDDESNLLQNEAMRLADLSLDSFRQSWASGIAGPLGRPVAQISFSLNHYFTDFSPFAFKITNLLIHAANSVLVFLLAERLLWATHPRLVRAGVGIIAALIAVAWLVHPIQMTSVLYVVQRMTSLSALFLLAALLLHIQVRQREEFGRYGAFLLVVAWAVLWPLSLFSKESGILFLGFVLAYELIIRRFSYGRIDRFGWILSGLIVAAVAAGVGYLLSPWGQSIWSGYAIRAFTLPERLLTEARVLWMYVGLIVFPRLDAFSLHHDYIRISTGLLAPWSTLPALFGIVGLVLAAWWSRIRYPLVAFGIAWFLVGHGLESTALPLEIAHEHRNYLALFGVLLVVTAALIRLGQQPGPGRTVGITLIAVVFAHTAFVTTLRAHQFGDEVRRTQIEAQHHPDSPRNHYEAAVALIRYSDPGSVNAMPFVLARRHYEIAGALDPRFKLGFLGLIHLNCQIDQPIEPEWLEELTKRLRETPFTAPDQTLLYSVRSMSLGGTLCLARPDVEDIFLAAVASPTIHPGMRSQIYAWLADYLVLSEGDLSAAEAALNRALELAPARASAQLNLAQVLFLQGREDETRGLLEKLDLSQLLTSQKRLAAELMTCVTGNDYGCALVRGGGSP
jgi:protein O-mannosyl-transferase